MKFMILPFLFISSAWAKPLVMISYFDAFNRASFNNSERVAKALEKRLNASGSPIKVSLCSLNTIFDKAYAQTEDCLKALTDTPVMVLGLGESNCDLKIETMMRNLDKTQGADNAGNRRNNTVIIPEAPAVVGLRYPLPHMYCALSSQERAPLDVSNNAGSFVCNNTAFQMSYHYPEIHYGFIHVPSNFCTGLARKTENAINALEKMILKAAEFLTTGEEAQGLPHSSNELRLSTKKAELKKLRSLYQREDQCLHEFLKRAKGYDEKRGLFGLN